MRLLVTHCSNLGQSETFIRAHLDRLPFEVTFVHKLPPEVVDVSTYISQPAAIADALEDHSEAYGHILGRERPDVVLAEYGPSGVVVLEACRIREIPLVVHFHGFDVSMQNVIDRYLDRYQDVFSYAHSLVVVSEAMRGKLTALGAPAEKITRCPYGVCLARFAPPKEPRQKRIVFVGRFVEKKGIILLLDAFATACRLLPDWSLQLFGDGPLRDRCEEKIQSLDLQTRVELNGPLHHEEVPKVLQGAAIVVVPSQSAPGGDSEGLPNVLLEAMACGCPAIGSTHQGIPDALQDGETGVLFPEGSVDGLTEAIVQLGSNRVLRDKMGKAARLRAESEYGMDRRIEALAEVLRSAGSR